MPMTLSTPEIGDLLLQSLRKTVPFAGAFYTDFSPSAGVWNQTITVRKPLVGTTQSWNATTGYATGAQHIKDLYEDVPVLLDKHEFYPLRLDHIDAESTIGNQDELLREQCAIGAGVIAKAVIDSVFAKITADTLSQAVTVDDAANVDKDTTIALRQKLLRARGQPRNLFLNLTAYGALEGDPRIESKDFHGQINGLDEFGALHGISGFANVFEYEDIPTAGNLIGFGLAKEAVLLATRVPTVNQKLADALGIPLTAVIEPISDPDTGLTLGLVKWQTPNTLTLNLAIVLMWGSSVGKQATASAAGSKTDYAGVRLVVDAEGEG